jgi:hypothetical protein
MPSCGLGYRRLVFILGVFLWFLLSLKHTWFLVLAARVMLSRGFFRFKLVVMRIHVFSPRFLACTVSLPVLLHTCQSAIVVFGKTYWFPLRNRHSKVFYFHSKCACNPVSIPWRNPMPPRHLRYPNHMHLVPKRHNGYSSNAYLREYTYMHAYLDMFYGALKNQGGAKKSACFTR